MPDDIVRYSPMTDDDILAEAFMDGSPAVSQFKRTHYRRAPLQVGLSVSLNTYAKEHPHG
jgi:hypothetical protein